MWSYKKGQNLQSFQVPPDHVFYFIESSKTDQIKEWAHENLKGHWRCWNVPRGDFLGPYPAGIGNVAIKPMIVIAVDSVEDAILFKITWG